MVQNVVRTNEKGEKKNVKFLLQISEPITIQQSHRNEQQTKLEDTITYFGKQKLDPLPPFASTTQSPP